MKTTKTTRTTKTTKTLLSERERATIIILLGRVLKEQRSRLRYLTKAKLYQWIQVLDDAPSYARFNFALTSLAQSKFIILRSDRQRGGQLFSLTELGWSQYEAFALDNSFPGLFQYPMISDWTKDSPSPWMS